MARFRVVFCGGVVLLAVLFFLVGPMGVERVLRARGGVGAVLVSLGVAVEVNWPVSDHPVGTIFAMLGGTIGLPFLMLGSTSPLLQVWWARREGGGVPYRLFALSNAGSLLALVVYPLVVEPRMMRS